LQPGLEVEARLLDGTALPGSLTFVASLAESSTRSFRVEARIDNPELRRIAGSSATLSIRLPEQQAHRLSPALLVLGDDGQVGIKAVNAEKKVEFLPVRILSFDPEGVWVGGLSGEVEIITLGAGFVAAGDAVNPVNAEQR
jgi:multidrug efflux system membrane fusion protein